MSIVLSAFLASSLFNLWIVANACKLFPKSLDNNLIAIQKNHSVAVPRIGGAGIFLGLLLGLLICYFQDPKIAVFGFLMLIGSLPVFVAGFLEDITKIISARFRLLAAIVSAALTGYFLDGWLSGLELLGVDNLMLAFPIVAIAITCFAVAGVSHSFNIIDGFNGLSAMVAIFVLLGIGYVAYQLSDFYILTACFVMIGGLIGFLILNYPRGLIFLGDGGAYLVGFWVAELCVLLTVRHQEVSKWFPLLLCFYPIFETLFSIYRRVIIRRKSPGNPDATHLHQLIHSRVVRFLSESLEQANYSNANSATSPFLWLLALASIIPAVLFWRNHIVLMLFAALFAFTYIYLYWSIVRFLTPKWLIICGKIFQY